MESKLKIFVVVLAAAFLLFGCASPSGKVTAVGTGDGAQAPVEQVQEKPVEKDSSAAVDISAKSPLEVEIEDRLAAAEDLKHRKTDLPEIFFRNLPAFPEDFYRMRILVVYGKISDLETVSEGYWKQPEFIPGFEENAVRLIKTPQNGRWGAFGYGAYPADTQVTTAPGAEFSVITYFHASWLVETYQGIKLVPVYNADSTLPTQDLQGSSTVVQDPEKVKEYFDVKISPETMVLGSTYPVLDYGWTQKAKVTVKVNPNTPPGRYVIGVNIASPSPEFNDQMMKKYLNLYTTGGAAVGVGRPFYQVAVTVR
jgi:hypothetical protein